MASVHREECWTRLRLAMVTVSMITMPQKRLDGTHSFTAGISVCQCGKCAEATLDVKTVLMLRSVMRISLVSMAGEIEKRGTWSQVSVMSTFTAHMEITRTMASTTPSQDKIKKTWISEGRVLSCGRSCVRGHRADDSPVCEGTCANC